MSDAIEVFKRTVERYDILSKLNEKEFNSFKEALLALEQKKNYKKQGALEELARIRNQLDILPNRHFKEYLRSILIKRIKKLEEGSAKTKGFLESPRKELGGVEK